MANGPRTVESKEYNNKPVIPGNKKIWFLNGDLVRFHHSSRSTGMVTVYNITKDRLETCLRSDFRSNREKAFSVSETAQLVNRHRKYFPSLVKRGVIPPPMGAQLNGKRQYGVRAYYSESQVKEIRDILASYHLGRPRKDKLITNSITPTKQELTRRIGNGILTYTKTEDGRFIPVWSEKT